MKPIVAEWVAKAEADFRSAQREQRVRTAPNPDLVCFLCQQCIEKYLKARLVESGVRFPKTHDLMLLLRLAQPVEPSLGVLGNRLEALNDYAVALRYPGETATPSEARLALANCRVIRRAARKCLGLDEPPSRQMKLQIKEQKARYRAGRRQ